MASILIVDDHTCHRKILTAELIKTYPVAEATYPEQTFDMIKRLGPTLVLINRLSQHFAPADLMLDIRKRHPKVPAMMYALRGSDAIRIIKQTIRMALQQTHSPADNEKNGRFGFTRLRPNNIFLNKNSDDYPGNEPFGQYIGQ